MTRELYELRAELDKTDRALIALLEKRMDAVRELAALKRAQGLPICDDEREHSMYTSRAGMVGMPCNAEYANALLTLLMRFSRREQRRRLNVYLIGMPGAGKSHFAKLIASSSELAALDTDAMVVAACGMSICDIFNTRGETEFRALERTALMECARAGSAVVATGGGIINKANTALMKGSGRLVFLDCSLDKLMAQDHSERPLIRTGADVERLYNERYAAYASAADLTLDPDSPGALDTLWDYCVE